MASRENTSPQPPASSEHGRKDKIMSVLSTSIDTINCVKDAIPNEIAKGLLSTFSGILSAVKNTIHNKEDFEELARQCYEISFLVWRATTATPNNALSLPVTRAIDDLKKSVNGVQDIVADRSKAGVASRMLSVTIDKEKITSWQRDLSRFLQIFNTELNILTHVKLEEIIAMFEQFRLQAETKTTAQGALPPSKPSLFVGRDNLVHEVSGLLAEFRHVALLGTGGIGKSCLAKAVLNEPAIVTKFGAQRYFIRYDDMDASQVSYEVFLGRVGGILGLALGAVDPLSVISTHLSSAPSLLILDNAETFLDAAQDKTRIADVVDSLGALASTVVLLTSRSRALPSNILWNVITVPALEPVAAREAFTAVYHKPIKKTDVIDSLLQSLDCHPLSINLLAHAARENDWSYKELLDTWNKKQIDLLHTGDGKSQSLIVTLELSLNSLSLRKLGDSVLHVLQIIAFLPQGIDRRELGGLFPSLPGASTIVDATCKQSITYRSGNFLTMLAPVRLYISTAYNQSLPQSIPLLTGIRTYYRDRLQKCGFSHGKIIDEGDWITAEDINVERVVTLELSLAENIIVACDMCTNFLYHLQIHNPRPTTLCALIDAIVVPKAASSKYNRRSLRLRVGVRSLMGKKTVDGVDASLLIEGKGNCLHALASFASPVYGYEVMFDILTNAKQLYSSVGSKRMEALCLRQIGEQYCVWGRMAAAEKSFEEAAHTLHDLKDVNVTADKAYLDYARGVTMVRKGEMSRAKLFFSNAVQGFNNENRPDWTKRCQSMLTEIIIEHGYLELWSGNYARSREHFNAVLSQARHWDYTYHEKKGLFGLFEVEMREKNFVKAKCFIDEICVLAGEENGSYGQLIIEALYCRACLYAEEGNFDDSRHELTKVISEIKWRDILFNYIMGRTELLAGNYAVAHEYFHLFLRDCDANANDLIDRTRGLRALGEVALCQQNRESCRGYVLR